MSEIRTGPPVSNTSTSGGVHQVEWDGAGEHQCAALAALHQRVERLTGALLSLVGDASGYDPSIVRGMALDFRRIATTDFHRDLCERVLSAEEQARAALADAGPGAAGEGE